MSRITSAIVLATLGLTTASAAPRAFVSSYGSDANTSTYCTQATPCRSFQAALSVVDNAGEVLALDSAGYGPVTISKAVTLSANPGVYAGILASSGTAVYVTTPDRVVLRGLDIKGSDAEVGIRGYGDIHVENCRISNFGVAGISTNGRLRVADTVIRNAFRGIASKYLKADIVNTQLLDNGRAGIEVVVPLTISPGSGAVDISVSDSVISNNESGIVVVASQSSGRYRLVVIRTTISANGQGVEATGVPRFPGFPPYYEIRPDVRATIGASQITGNVTGLVQTDIAVFESMGDNVFAGNGTDTVGLISVVPGT